MRFARVTIKCAHRQDLLLNLQRHRRVTKLCQSSFFSNSLAGLRRCRAQTAVCHKQPLCSTVRGDSMSEQQFQVLQPVQATRNGLTTYSGDSILTGCFKTASVTEKDADGIVLGVTTSEGPAAILDVGLGKVRGGLLPVSSADANRPQTRLCTLQLNSSRFLSSARNKIWWMTPHWGSQACDILPGDVHHCLRRLEQTMLC